MKIVRWLLNSEWKVTLWVISLLYAFVLGALVHSRGLL